MVIHLASLLFAGMGMLVRLLTLPASSPTGGWLAAGGAPLEAYEVAFWRSLLGALALTPALWGELRRSDTPLRRHPGAHLLRGLLGSLALICYFRAIALLGYSSAVLLCYTSPLFATLFGAWLLGERASVRTLGGFLLAFTGISAVQQGGLSLQSPLAASRALLLQGLVLGLASGVLAGAAYTSIRHLANRASTSSIVGVLCWLGTILTAPLAWQSLHYPTWRQVGALLAMAALANGGQWFLTLGYRKYSASQASTMNLSIVLFAWGLDALLLGVRCTATQMLGLGLTLGGIILAGNSALPTRAR